MTKNDFILFSINNLKRQWWWSMVLFNIEYEVPNGMTYICKVIGNDETDVMDDLVSQVGRIRVISIHRVSEVHRITGTVRKSIIEGSLLKKSTRGKGRPRKLDF